MTYRDDETHRYGIDMSKWFCFAQSTTGKILGVFHPKNEENEIINFKKSIAAAFQANFKGTSEEDEGDSQTFHHSHYKYIYISVIIISLYYLYRYYSENNRQIQQRTVDENDVIQYAGNSKTPKKALHFHQEDKIEVDEKKRIYFSTGKSTIDVRGPGKADEDEEDGYSLHDLPSLKATSEYKLVLSYCEENYNPIGKKQSRRVRGLKSNAITDDILAKNDQSMCYRC